MTRAAWSVALGAGLVLVTGVAVLLDPRGDATSSGSPSSASTEVAGDGTSSVAPAVVATPSAEPGTPRSGPSPATSPSPSPPPPVIRGSFDGQRALMLATRLAEAGPRPAGSDADRAARSLVAAELRTAGWSVAQHDLQLPQGGWTANVVATLSGLGVPDGAHVVVGAHLDTVADSPGANDNASGVAVLVEVARELRDEAADLALPVVLVAFGAEEYQPSSPREHHLGSDRYAEAHVDDVVAMLSIDMVGNGPATCVCWYDAGPPTLAERLREVADAAGIAEVLVQRRGDVSDHGPFARRGIPAAFLWSFEDPALHSPQDTADRLDVADLQRAGDLVLAWLRGLTTP